MKLTWARPLLPALVLLALAAPPASRTIVWVPLVEGRSVSEGSEPHQRPVRPNRHRLPIHDHPPAAKEGGSGRQEAELSRLIAVNADEWAVTRQVDKVEGIRANLNKTRTLMLLRMRQVLTPDQRVQLNKLYEQHRRRRDDEQEEIGASLQPGNGETGNDTERNDLDPHDRGRPLGALRRRDPGARGADLGSADSRADQAGGRPRRRPATRARSSLSRRLSARRGRSSA